MQCTPTQIFLSALVPSLTLLGFVFVFVFAFVFELGLVSVSGFVRAFVLGLGLGLVIPHVVRVAGDTRVPIFLAGTRVVEVLRCWG